MNKLLILCFTVYCIVSARADLFSQQSEINKYMIVRSTPTYTLSLNINTNQSILELSGTYNDDVHSTDIYDGETFGADKGFGVHIISKISLGERGTFRFCQVLSYNKILSYAFAKKDNLYDKGEANYNAFTGGLGMEYNFTPAHRFKMYFGAEINASMINGKTTIWFYNHLITPTYTQDYTIKNSFRMGYGLNIGSEYLLNNSVGLHLGVRLVNLNAFIKSAKGTNADTEFELRDDDSPGLNFAGRKSFSFYSILGGVNFYFGVSEKRYKIK